MRCSNRFHTPPGVGEPAGLLEGGLEDVQAFPVGPVADRVNTELESVLPRESSSLDEVVDGCGVEARAGW